MLDVEQVAAGMLQSRIQTECLKDSRNAKRKRKQDVVEKMDLFGINWSNR